MFFNLKKNGCCDDFLLADQVPADKHGSSTVPQVFALINQDGDRVPVVSGNIDISESPIVGRYSPRSFIFKISNIVPDNRYNEGECGYCTDYNTEGILTLPPDSNQISTSFEPEFLYNGEICNSGIGPPGYYIGVGPPGDYIGGGFASAFGDVVSLELQADTSGIYAEFSIFRQGFPIKWSWVKQIGSPIKEGIYYDSVINGYNNPVFNFNQDDMTFISEEDGCPGEFNTFCDFSTAVINITGINEDYYRSRYFDLNNGNLCNGLQSTTLLCTASGLTDIYPSGFGSCNSFNRVIPIYNSTPNNFLDETWSYTFKKYTNATASNLRPFDCFCGNEGPCLTKIDLNIHFYEGITSKFLGEGEEWSDVTGSGLITLYDFSGIPRLKYSKQLCMNEDCYTQSHPVPCSALVVNSNFYTSKWTCEEMRASLNNGWNLISNTLDNNFQYCNWNLVDFTFQHPDKVDDFCNGSVGFNYQGIQTNSTIDPNCFSGEILITNNIIGQSYVLSPPNYRYDIFGTAETASLTGHEYLYILPIENAIGTSFAYSTIRYGITRPHCDPASYSQIFLGFFGIGYLNRAILGALNANLLWDCWRISSCDDPRITVSDIVDIEII